MKEKNITEARWATQGLDNKGYVCLDIRNGTRSQKRWDEMESSSEITHEQAKVLHILWNAGSQGRGMVREISWGWEDSKTFETVGNGRWRNPMPNM